MRHAQQKKIEKEIFMARSKYNVDDNISKRTYDGIVFDSVMEMKYYRDVLCPLLESGEVIEYELQKSYELQPGFMRNGKKVLPIIYVADFWVKHQDGHEVVIDVKGCPDAKANLKRKMFWYRYPDIDYRWISYCKQDGGWIDYQILKKNRAERKRRKHEKE